jgi:hypothetical protein
MESAAALPDSPAGSEFFARLNKRANEQVVFFWNVASGFAQTGKVGGQPAIGTAAFKVSLYGMVAGKPRIYDPFQQLPRKRSTSD